MGRRSKPGANHAKSQKTPPANTWVVNGYSAEWLGKGFPWVYPKEVVSRGKQTADTVTLRSADGRILGRGVPDQGFIAARVFRHGEGELDRDFLWLLLDNAADLRDTVIPPETTAYRLVHGENDGLPGIRIDWWDHVATIALDSPALAVFLPHLTEWLEERRAPRAIYLCYRPDPRDTRDWTAPRPAPGLIAGHELTSELRVLERGAAFKVRPWEGPDVGLYTDMRAVRAWLEPHWGGTAVLNTFAYTGAFSVVAALGGASEIVTVDLAAPAIERAKANFVTNELDPADHDFLVEDTFKALDRFRRRGQRFDRIILDPPSFSHSADGTLWSAKKDYPRLVAAAMRALNPGGWLIAASNHGQTSPRDFRGYIIDGAKRANLRAQELAWLGQSADVPAATWFPEGRYLKVGVWRALPK